ncbi:HipA domain-containing protein [[Clostridium] aminophilum]|uniref:HipA domain-containing protein n=1 Tax=[Clostridium] aminophilum TaxID=1526 RepID=UPI003F963166
MIDFTNCERLHKGYSGSNGNKISIRYNDEIYMLKFPSTAKLNNNMSYANGCISEYLGCHIFGLAGIPVQETLLGKYYDGRREKIVVACKDMTSIGVILQDFASLKNQAIASEQNGYGTELKDILYTIDDQTAMDPQILKDFFWDMFIVDALIGNWDRHNGNWGFLYDQNSNNLEIAPVYDCGSSLFPQADEIIMRNVLENPGELGTRIYNRPLSAILIDGRKINYYDYISSMQNEDVNLALKRIAPKIKENDIIKTVDDIDILNDLQKAFYKKMLIERKHILLDETLNAFERTHHSYGLPKRKSVR